QAPPQLETNEAPARASSGNPDNPAWNDLDYYGSWYNLPGYGQVWSPSGVTAAWDPFGNGAWDFLDGYGWVWIPGNCGYGFYGSGWYPYSTVWNVPPGYGLPVRPRGLP